MRFLARAWADTAPVVDAYERVILYKLAETAGNDGTGAAIHLNTLAAAACCSADEVAWHLDQMADRGLTTEREEHRVDLLIPHSWYSTAQLQRVNEDRAERGLPPLTEEARPQAGAR